MLEREIEKKLVNEVKGQGGLALKLVSPSMVGIPDRLILMPHGRVAFVEVKRPGGKARPIQVKRIKELKALGFKCFILDDEQMVERIIEEVVS